MNVIADYISREGEKVGEGNNAELSLEQWKQFLAAHENELPTPGDEWCVAPTHVITTRACHHHRQVR